MHHLYPISKGDKLCPLGFHPQVRWPTRCKRCFRDYKEHGGKRNPEDIISSTPNLSESSNSRSLDESKSYERPGGRSWTSSQNLSSFSASPEPQPTPPQRRQRPNSWTSTPDLNEDQVSAGEVKSEITVNLPRRRHTTTIVAEETITVKRPPLPPSAKSEDIVIYKTDSLAERYRKMQIIKRQQSLERESSSERETPSRRMSEEKEHISRKVEQKPVDLPRPPKPEPKKSPEIKRSPTPKIEIQPPPPERRRSKSPAAKPVPKIPETSSSDVKFLIQVKNSSPTKSKHDDTFSISTDTTDTTLVGAVDSRSDGELLEQIESLKQELDSVKQRCDKAERDKSDLLLRRLASMDTTSNRTAASEALKLQQKVNELSQVVEDLRDDKKSLSLKVRELEQDLEKGSKSVESDLRKKLEQAQHLCEELMDENEDMKKELRNMEHEIDEMQDNFREDQVDEYSTIKKELDQTTKNCRILSFKLKKADRKIEQLEGERQSLGTNTDLMTKVKQLEEQLKESKEYSKQLEIENAQSKKKAPSLGTIGKSTSADGKVARGSLIRSGSQEDPGQLQRDLNDSMEREQDLREQLKFSQEENKATQTKLVVENKSAQTTIEPFEIQSFPRSTQTEDTISERSEEVAILDRVRDRISVSPEPSSSRSFGFLNNLRPLFGQFYFPNVISTNLIAAASGRKLSPTSPSRLSPIPAALEKDEGISDEEDPAELRLLLELNEQEASVLRRKIEELEKENTTYKRQVKELEEKLLGKDKDNKRLPTILSKTPAGINAADKKIKTLEDEIVTIKKKLSDKEKEVDQLQKTSNKSSDINDHQTINFKRKLEIVEQEASVLRSKLQKLEKENDQLSTENKKLSVQAARGSMKKETDKATVDINKIKEELKLMELERDELKEKVKKFMEIPNGKFPERVPRKYSETLTKTQLKKMIEDLEGEVIETRALAVNFPNTDKKGLSKTDSKLEEKIQKNEGLIKELEATKKLLENQLKQGKEEVSKLEKEIQNERKENSKWESKVAELDEDLQLARKNAEKSKANLEKEISNLKAKVLTPEAPTKKIQLLKDQASDLESRLNIESAKYKELTGKYEILEEEHVLTKAQLTTEKEAIQSELYNLNEKMKNFKSVESKFQSEITDLTKRLESSRNKIREMEKSQTKSSSIELERNQLKSKLTDTEAALQKLRRENEMNIDKSMSFKRDNEELRQKLDDFERVHKAQRNLSDHNAEMEQEMKKLKIRLENAELNVKSEVASTRLRYEQQVKTLQTELTSMQSQCERFKRDRDSFKQLLEGAQKKISELKHSSSSGRQSRSSIHSGDEDDKSKILGLEQQVGCLEDELSESRLEASKLKTELVSEKTASEIKIAEMQSQINEYEEERLLTGGGKIPGTKTRIELSWQKEREEQQRLLQETSMLARDLRQTLFEVERERDKERLEMRRKLEQLKKNTEDEMDEGRRKISELQCDLLELRDAHAKLRTANEKLRRERERYDRDREYTSRRRMENDGEKKVGALLQTVDELVKIAPELKKASDSKEANGQLLRPVSPSREKSRSPSPTGAALQINSVLARLAEASEELRKYQRLCENDREREKLRRGGMRRAASTEHDSNDLRQHSRLSRNSQHNGSLTRKSLSLDQSMQHDQAIWKRDDDSMSSMQSIDSDFGGMVRDPSLDSRLSGGSTQSDMARGPRKKKRGLMGRLRSLTKTRSIDSDASQQGSDSDLSLAGDIRGSKQNIKGRLSGMFRRSNPGSRAGSTEKIIAVTTPEVKPKPVAVQTICTDALPPSTHPPPSPAPVKLKTVKTPAAKPPTPTNSTQIGVAQLRKTNYKLK